MTWNFRRWAFVPAVLALGVWTAACSEGTTSVPMADPPPLFGELDPSNEFGECMGNDVLSYNALVPAAEKSSWSNTAEPNGNYCTAKDIYLASAAVYAVYNENTDTFDPVNPGDAITCVEGETFRVKVAAQLGQQAASARTDIGVWIAQSSDPETIPISDQAVDGTCNHYNLVLGESSVVDLDGDECGDMESEVGELTDLDLDELVLSCSPNEDDKVEVPSCIGWTVPGADRECPFPEGGADAAINFRMGTVPSNTSKCNCENFVLDIIVLEEALLEVRKELDPTTDAGLFNLLIDAGTPDQIAENDVGHNGTTGAQSVGAGTSTEPGATHTFSESQGTGTLLSDYETTWECRDRGGLAGSRGTGTGAGPEDIELEPDDDVVCTFTNARKPEVKLVKEFAPSTDDGEVSFTIGGTSDDNGGAGYGHDGETDWYQFDIGDDVAFSEAGFGGLDLGDYESSWECDNGEDGTGTSGSTGALAAGDQVTCTFTNALNPVVKLVKEFDPTDDGGKVEFTIGGNSDDNSGAGYGHQGETDWHEFEIGDQASFSEAGFGSTDLGDYESEWECDDGESGTGTSGMTATLAAGDMVTCTFTNARKPEVRVEKLFDPTDDGGLVEFDVGGNDDDNSAAGYGHQGITAYYQFDIGDDVAFSEAGFGSTDLDNYESEWECDNTASGTGTSGSTGVLAAGDQVTCTFTNARKPEVRVKKLFSPTTDLGRVSFVIDGNSDDNAAAGYGHNGTTAYYVVDIGDDVAFSEAGFGGTLLTAYTSTWACDNGASGNGTSGLTGALAAGDQVTCTFTNTLIPVVIDTETAWASNLLGTCCTLRFNPNGTKNWATYVVYSDVLKVVTLYAGQTQAVGTVTFSALAGGNVTITVQLSGGWTFADGSVLAVKGYTNQPSGNPSPGQFPNKVSASGTTAQIVVPDANYFAVHAVVQE